MSYFHFDSLFQVKHSKIKHVLRNVRFGLTKIRKSKRIYKAFRH